MKILVLGYGASGRAAEQLALRLGHAVEVREDGKDVAGIPSDAAFAVVSPGVPLSSPLIAACRARGVSLKSELQFGCEELKRQGWKLLAVTGSKGKSSVVKVVADALALAGHAAVPCGNYGLPVSAVATSNLQPPTSTSTSNLPPPTSNIQPPTSTSRWAVVEVSSFMLETTDLPADTFEAAAILNLQEDHLDRHGSVETYHALKRRLLTMTSVAHAFDMSRLEEHPVWAGVCADGPDELYAGSYFDNEILSRNGLAAVLLLNATGAVDRAAIRRAFQAFAPLPHRMNRVATIVGVDYIDDSKATSLAALAAGVRMACAPSSGLRRAVAKLGFPERRRILLIAGGLPKGDDPKSVLSTLAGRVRKVYLIGRCAKAFADAWKGSVDCEICGTMERAVAAAKREAEAGDKVLLSPGTASFDQFKSFGERGDVFARLVSEFALDFRGGF